MNDPYIQISHGVKDNTDLFNVRFRVSNGSQTGYLEFYSEAEMFLDWASKLEMFPRHQHDVILYERGSEYPEDRNHRYFRMRLFTLDAAGHCALHFRLNNNQPLPDREISEFCMKAEPGQINEFGRALRKFAELKHCELKWTVGSVEMREHP